MFRITRFVIDGAAFLRVDTLPRRSAGWCSRRNKAANYQTVLTAA